MGASVNLVQNVLDFYHLCEHPFAEPPTLKFLFLSASQSKILATIGASIKAQPGVVVVLSEAGLGKTTLVQRGLEAINLATAEVAIRPLAPGQLKTIYLPYPRTSFGELMEYIAYRLGLGTEAMPLPSLARQLHHALLREVAAGRYVTLVIDDAHRMPIETLRALEGLARSQLCQIVLLGLPELWQILRRRELRPLRQCIVARTTLTRLSRQESRAYIAHRLATATAASPAASPIFSKQAVRRLVHYAKGQPSVLNRLCDDALYRGAQQQESPISSRLVAELIGSYQQALWRQRSASFWHWAWAGCLGGLLGLSLWWTIPLLDEVSPSSEEPSSPAVPLVARGPDALPAADAQALPRVVPLEVGVQAWPEVFPERSPAVQVAAVPQEAAGGQTGNHRMPTHTPPAVAPDAALPPVASGRMAARRISSPSPILVKNTAPARLAMPTLPAPGVPVGQTGLAEHAESIRSALDPCCHKGLLSVVSYPQGTVFLNGKEMGRTPLVNVEVSVGNHEIMLRANGREQKKRLVIRHNVHDTLAFRFERSP